MKRFTLFFFMLAAALFTTQVFSEEVRKFTSADGTKSFEGVFSNFDAASGVVEVELAGLGVMKFQLSILSEADQTYIKEHGDGDEPVTDFVPKASKGGKNRMEVRSVTKDLENRMEAVNSKYLAAFPPAFTKAKSDTIPLVIYLHGSAGRGDDPMSCIDMPFNQIIGSQKEFPAMVISPQLRSVMLEGAMKPRMSWHLEDLERLLEDVLNEFPQIDQDRVYLTGFSMGGFGTWDWAAASRKRFAAILPIAGGANTAAARDPKNFGDLPIQAFHGDADTNVDPQGSIRLFESIKAVRGDVHLTIFPGVTHECSEQVYLDPEVYRWLFSKKRS
jgi:predicted peptidase